jgi:membrane protein involved in colicin uptake
MPKPKGGGGVNQKVAAANDKKAQNEAQVKAKQSAEQEKAASKEWSDGANLRGAKKADDAAAKADEAARKKREKEALLAEEESTLGTGSGKPKNKIPVLSKQGKNKKKDDLSLLENALVGAADKKAKAQKLADRQKADEAKRLEQEKALKKEQEKPMDPLLANTEQMLAGTADELVGRAANVALGVDGAGSGIDAALGSLNLGGGGGGVVVTNRKALYMAFEERKMAELKQEQPGLKMSQYKERIFALWKKSPENPENQVK